MSAFIVGPDCINSIVTYVQQHADCFGWLQDEFGYDVKEAEEVRRLAGALHLLNCNAVDQRYGKGMAVKDTSARRPFAFRSVPGEPFAVHKAACCLQYQCMEGDVPRQPLFRALGFIISRIAHNIVSELPGYDEAPWGD